MMKPTRGVIWGAEDEEKSPPAKTKGTKTNKGHFYFLLNAPDSSDDLMFRSFEADILIRLCQDSGKWVKVDVIREELGFPVLSKRVSQLVAKIVDKLEKIPEVKIEPLSSNQKKSAKSEEKRTQTPRYGKWRVPVLGGELALERKKGELRVIYQDAAQHQHLHQLPADPTHFVGRSEELGPLLARKPTRGVLSVGLRGMGGIGKTTLAIALANEWKSRFPDAQIFLRVNGSTDDSQSPAPLLATVIHAFHPQERLLLDTSHLECRQGELESIYRDTLASKRVLIVLDNAQKAEQIKALIPPAGCALIVTSRQGFVLGNTPFHPIGRMNDDDAAELLRGFYAHFEEKDIGSLIALCDGLPLALRIAGSHIALDASERGGRAHVASYLKKLREARLSTLDGDALDTLEISVSQTLSLSEGGLTSQQKQVWYRLSVFPDSFDAPAAAFVTGCEEGILEILVRRSLVERVGQRYRLHDLVRDFTQARLMRNSEEDHQAHLNHATHYLSVLLETNRLYLEGGDSIAGALSLFDEEWSQIEVAQKWVSEHLESGEKVARLCIDYPRAGVHSLSLRLHVRGQMRWLKDALSAYQSLNTRDKNDIEKQALLIHNLGLAHSKLGEMDKAIGYYEQSLVLMMDLEHHFYEALCRANCGWACYKSKRQSEAFEHYERGLRAAERITDPRKKSDARLNVLTNWGIAYKDAEQFDLALAHYNEALIEACKIEDRRMQGNLLGNVGIVYDLKGEFARAIAYYQQQDVIAKEMGDKRGQATVLFNTSLATYNLGDLPKALELAKESLALCQFLEDPMALDVEEQLEEWHNESAQS